ncbi:MAG: helix-turn-helix transcriptional regulator [Clostridia bacterium]|nr:helix-turn-helix transcriptional regulator [Clostridia bacterium]
MANLTTRLRELRREQDMTQEALGAAIGIGKSTYQNYEQGISGAPLHRLLDLSEYLDVSLDYLSGHSDERIRVSGRLNVVALEPFSQRLRKIRKEHKMTQKAVAEQIGIIGRTYIKYEHGEIVPPIDKLIKLSDLFDITMDELAGRTDLDKRKI